MDEGHWLELLDTYIEMVEVQDRIIGQLSKIVAKQAASLQLMTSDAGLDKDLQSVNKEIDGYKKSAERLEP